MIYVCDICGDEICMTGPDAIAFCRECGIVEDNYHEEDDEADS